jgi:formylglycine-generating enzyme required for sulfatase activity
MDPSSTHPSLGFRVARSLDDAPPAWWAQVPPGRRPPLPLPEGLVFGEEKGDYLNVKDGSLLRWIPAERFVRGPAASKEHWSELSEGQRRAYAVRDPNAEANQARIAEPGVFVGKLELSAGRFERFLRAQGREPQAAQAPDLPVVGLTRAGASAYCEWAGLRLPTHDEWELAARGTDGRQFPWGDEPWEPSRANLQDAERSLRAVGSYPRGASPYGCLDMCGNAAEWVADGSPGFCELRGGSCETGANHTSTHRRDRVPADVARRDAGFRVARGYR